MDGLIDVHCHILPYVDDGAENMEQALALLQMQQEQGVSTVIVTPHFRKGMFESSQEKVINWFHRLQKEAEQLGCGLSLQLGREYYCNSGFSEILRSGNVQTLGNSSCVLIEFSGRHSLEDIYAYLKAVKNAGYQPVIAHVERYEILRKHPEELAALVQAGACCQINAGSIIGEDGWRVKHICRRWMKENLIHLVGSDCHRTYERIPNLGKAAAYVEKKMGKAYARQIFYDNPTALLNTASAATEER